MNRRDGQGEPRPEFTREENDMDLMKLSVFEALRLPSPLFARRCDLEIELNQRWLDERARERAQVKGNESWA